MNEQERAFQRMVAKQQMFPKGFNNMSPAEREAAERQLDARVEEVEKNTEIRQRMVDGARTFNVNF